MADSTNLTNQEIVAYLGLPDNTITLLQTSQGEDFTAISNQFISKLVNKIVYQKIDRMGFENPFKRFDSFPVNYGDTIENIFTELPKGYTYDKDNTDPFTKYIPNVKTLYATINYEMQYPLTIHDVLLRRACLNEYGFMGLINTMLETLNKSKSIDEYFATISMLNNKNIYANAFEEITKGKTDSETAKILTEKIVDVTSSFALPSKTNNKLRVLNTSSKKDILLIIKRTLLNNINLDYLAGVYNLSKVELIDNIIPVDTFQVEDSDGKLVGDDFDFAIIDSNGFDNHVALEDSGLIYNPKGKYTNHFSNLWKIISFKYYFNARAFKLVAPGA